MLRRTGLAFYVLNKKKARARRKKEDADTGAPGSMTPPTEANSDGSSSLPTETNDGGSTSSPMETNNGASTSRPTATNSGGFSSFPTEAKSGGSSSSPTETKSGGSSPSPTGISKGASSSSPTETNNSASSSSTATTGNRYEVFLSFRGPDTRKAFASHLYKGLHDAGIVTFRDKEELPQGEDIGPEILAAITKSQILIPILSEGYGTSSWCLNELAQIMKCKNDNGQMVLPVFYKVKPAEVRYQRGSFGKAFHEYEERLLKRPSFDPTSLEKWKKALGEVSTLKGYEADGVLRKLKKKFELDISENLVGIDRHVEEIMEVVDTKKSHATLFLGIHGMGGIGKTTLAKAIYNKLSNQFKHRSYIADIRESWKRNGALYLQNRLIHDILKRENEVHNEDEGVKYISSKFKGKKVLLLLDDVDVVIQLKHLAGNRDWFSSGSMIIITTVNVRILEEFGVDYPYEHKEMENDQSMILFSKHAFRSDSPRREFEDLAHEVVSMTGGLPLSLEVLGSLLCGKELAFWRSRIDKLKKVPHEEVQKKLRISYEVLEYEQKQIFLDIACFFIGTDRRIASYMWGACGFFPGVEIEVLRYMSLIKIEDDHKLRMHDQLRDLGREIVREEKRPEPQNRSRLWDFEEVKKVLKKNKGTEKIEAIFLSKGSSEGSGKAAEQDGAIHTEEQFKKLTGLRFLHVKGGISSEKLKFLDLSHCESLENTNFLSDFKNLEVLILNFCGGLQQIDSSIGDMKALLRLEPCFYTSLAELPAEIGKSRALEQLLLQHTRALSTLPDSMGRLQNLETLNISWSGVRGLPSAIGRPRKLRHSDASCCKDLEGEMPGSIGSLENLEILNIFVAGVEELPIGAPISVGPSLQLNIFGCHRSKSQIAFAFPPNPSQGTTS
ncbi:disease resistance protein RUN1-like [Rhodamnia argentea]|uniref:Disease resistance protein RUN1-like n=1 Tax=Rhodamnia argentea TaxID=178133 RepID=A0ABM3H4A4_9MYRT|nr:disease resistance protein RUN1-like [Rhodamnia argentea]